MRGIWRSCSLAGLLISDGERVCVCCTWVFTMVFKYPRFCCFQNCIICRALARWWKNRKYLGHTQIEPSTARSEQIQHNQSLLSMYQIAFQFLLKHLYASTRVPRQDKQTTYRSSICGCGILTVLIRTRKGKKHQRITLVGKLL